MNFSDLINAFERFAFQIISWIILIPKTLFWILAAPKSMVNYIDDELTSDNPNFKSFISPIFLFLFVGLGPIILESEVKLPHLKVEGKTYVLKDSTYTYTAKIDQLSEWTDFRAERYVYEYVWSYTEGDSNYIINTFLFDNYIPEENEVDIVFQDSDTNVIDLKLDIYAYQLGTDADSTTPPNVMYSDSNELDEDYAYVSIDTMYFKKQIPITIFDNIEDLKSAEKLSSQIDDETNNSKSNLTEQQIYATGIALLLLPLFFSIGMILKNREKVTLPILKRYLYAQCALFSPVVLIFNFFILLSSLLPEDFFSDESILLISIFWLISILWFAVTEVKVYKLNKLQSVGILFGIPLILILLVMFFIEAFVEFSNFKWIIWLFSLGLCIPIVLSFFIKNKKFIDEEEFDQEEPEAS